MNLEQLIRDFLTYLQEALTRRRNARTLTLVLMQKQVRETNAEEEFGEENRAGGPAQHLPALRVGWNRNLPAEGAVCRGASRGPGHSGSGASSPPASGPQKHSQESRIHADVKAAGPIKRKMTVSRLLLSSL